MLYVDIYREMEGGSDRALRWEVSGLCLRSQAVMFLKGVVAIGSILSFCGDGMVMFIMS